MLTFVTLRWRRTSGTACGQPERHKRMHWLRTKVSLPLITMVVLIIVCAALFVVVNFPWNALLAMSVSLAVILHVKLREHKQWKREHSS